MSRSRCGYPPRSTASARVLARVCGLMLLLMVVFTCYTVVMRTVFQDPPFWGDTMALFANVWLVMLAFALSIRERSSISMQMLYNYLPDRAVAALELLWTILFIAVGVFIAIYGYQVASRIPGVYWELDSLPKSVPMIILPVSGLPDCGHSVRPRRPARSVALASER